MATEIYGPVPDTLATDQELEDAIDQVEIQIINVNNTLDARLDVLEAGTSLGIYVHIQDAAASVWTIVHNLGYYPNITTVDTLNREIAGDEEYIDTNTVQVTFSVAVPGKAYLS